MKRTIVISVLLVLLAVIAISRFNHSDYSAAAAATSVFTDYRSEKPGTTHKITIADLPEPFATNSADNAPEMVDRPANAWPQVPAGFKVELYARGFDYPRLIRTAPNGDLFLAESRLGEIKVLRGVDAQGRAQQTQVFASGLRQPFGIAFYPPGSATKWVYVANTSSVVRFPYQSGDLKARGPAETVVKEIPGGGLLRGGGHWTRDIAFSKDGSKMFVSVGSRSNDDDTDGNSAEVHRADILEFNPDGSGERIYAWGIRNAVGIAVDPASGELWCSTNERDGLGDNLVPDYITHVTAGGFYGWPWWYMGGHQDPRHKGKHPELQSKVITPDVLIQPHNASLEMTFYEPASATAKTTSAGGRPFPEEFRGDIFASEHGSWNRGVRTGYEVIRVPMHHSGRAGGEYQDFLTGFVTPEGQVWGRPVGVAVGKDGSLYISDDGSKSVWRVSYTGK